MVARWMAVLGCAFALALVAPPGNEAHAGPAFKYKRCIAPSMRGAPQTWVCRASEFCCYDWLLRRGTCPATRCF